MVLAVHNVALCNLSPRKRMSKAAPNLTSSHPVWNHGFCLLILLSSALKMVKIFGLLLKDKY